MKSANLWQIFQAGGPTMVPLGVLSVITLALVLAFLFSIRRGSMSRDDICRLPTR